MGQYLDIPSELPHLINVTSKGNVGMERHK